MYVYKHNRQTQKKKNDIYIALEREKAPKSSETTATDLHKTHLCSLL